MHRTALAEEVLEEEMDWCLALASKITPCCPKVKATLDTMEVEVILEVVAMPPLLPITTKESSNAIIVGTAEKGNSGADNKNTCRSSDPGK